VRGKSGDEMGKFIVIEGPDGSGKSTLANNLTAYVRNKMGLSISHTCEPSYGTIGRLLRGALRGDIVFSPSVLERLFIADREDHCLKDIGPDLENGHVICDRYYYSTMVYQALEYLNDWDFFERYESNAKSYNIWADFQARLMDMFQRILESHFNRSHNILRPDMVIILTADDNTLMSRLSKRGSEREIYDDKKRVECIALAYRQLHQWVNNVYWDCNFECKKDVRERLLTMLPKGQIIMDCSNGTEEEVFQEAVLHIDNLLGK
jgi:thymidylate kinase